MVVAVVVSIRAVSEPAAELRDIQPSAPAPTDTDTGATTIVQNKLAVGPALFEDSTPAFLSSRPVPYCLRRGCVVDGTHDLWSGATLEATCQIAGEPMTNANESSPGLDKNPDVVRSDRWYYASWNGYQGFLPEVFVTPTSRGGLHLPKCR